MKYRKELGELVADNMTPPNSRGQAKPPGKARQRRTAKSQATDGSKSPNVLFDTPRRIFREHDAVSDELSTTSLTASETQALDSGFDEWHGYGDNRQIGAYDDASSSSSGVTHDSTGSAHPSSSSSGSKAYVKKRRRLSVRQGAGESSTIVLSDLAPSENIDPGSIPTFYCHQHNN